MWILPKNLQWSNGAPDTEAFISDLNEQSQICASSLMVRSKPSLARIWLQKWKRDSWTQHLSGRILKPSHAKSFVTEWTSLWQVIPANLSPQQVNDSEQKTQDTSGRTSPEQFELFSLDSVSLKMSKDTSPSDSERSLESWNQSVTRRRGEYSARVKSAHPTSGSVFSSSAWPTVRASEFKDVGPVGSKSHDHMLGKGYLCAVVTQEAAWPTPCAMEAEKAGKFNKGQMGQSLSAMANRGELTNWPTPQTSDMNGAASPDRPAHRMQLRDVETGYGHPAPANPSTDGSRQGSQQDWRTPGASDGEGGIMEMREGAAGKYKLRDHVAHESKQNWVTPRSCSAMAATISQESANDPKRFPNLETQVGQQNWATPRSGKTSDENPETWAQRQAKGDVATMPLGTQVKAWATPNAFAFQPPENTEQWEKRAKYQQQEKGVNLHKPIQSQVLHENEKVVGPMPPSSAKLNARWVEGLMNLHLGWTCPSCPASVIRNWPKFVSGCSRATIAPTNSDSSATESCQQQQNELFES